MDSGSWWKSNCDRQAYRRRAKSLYVFQELRLPACIGSLNGPGRTMNERDDKGEKVRDNTSYQFFFGLWTKSGPHCQYKIPPLPAHQQVTVYVCRASTHIHSTCLAMDCCYRDSTLRWECLAIWFPQRDCGLERGGRRTRRGACGSGVASTAGVYHSEFLF